TFPIFLSKPVTPSLLGEYDKPSLSAWPSPMVPLGQTVTLQCHFRSPRKRFKLFKTDGTSLTELHGNHFNTFTLGPVTREHAGSYTCSRFSSSLPVDPLQIVVTGVFTKPSISAHPSPLMRAGENVTLRCQSLLWFDKFILHQENSPGHFQRRGQMLTSGHAPADFSIGPMTLASAGTYRCYGSFSHSPYVWSAPSDPVDIIISGLSKKPSLSAQGGPVVRSGENVTLVCSSESAFDQFHLLRDGENLECPLAGGQSPHGTLQAEFPLGPGTPDHSGVYRCYGSFTRSPYSWSDSSDPLFLSVTESTTSTSSSPMDPHTTEEAPLPREHSSTWYIVLGLVIAFTSTSIILAALVCRCFSTQNHVSFTEGEPKEDRIVNSEDPAAEDVIYANLNHRTLPMHPFTEPSIHEEFNVNHDHAEP
uniref:Ig-like domain-containing protein n=1 Tax=Capra hircus TaxID=9925 RepID=A0A452EZE9_CAPHI